LTFTTQSVYLRPFAKPNSKGAAAMSEYLNEMIGYQVQGTAEWRHQKAAQFPEDARNLKAAEQLERLAAEIDGLQGSQVEIQISDAQDSINGLDTGDVWQDLNETVSSQLRAIGFYNVCPTSTELLEWYRDLLIERVNDLNAADAQLGYAPARKVVQLSDPARESTLRSRARRRGYRLTKSRKALSIDNFGKHQLVDVNQNIVILGSRFDADLGDIEKFLAA
jgi:hypothetical protein